MKHIFDHIFDWLREQIHELSEPMQDWMGDTYNMVDLGGALDIINEAEAKFSNGHFGCNTNGEHEKCEGCGIADRCSIYKKNWFVMCENSPEKEEVCEWECLTPYTHELSSWKTSCGYQRMITIVGNEKHCIYCGKPIKISEVE